MFRCARVDTSAPVIADAKRALNAEDHHFGGFDEGRGGLSGL
jgi:hypothetical protein